MIRLKLDELSDHISLAKVPIREALQRLNAARYLFQLVVDGDGRLLGTLTDGDIRRGLLRGASLETTVDDFMFTDCLIGRDGDLAANERLLLDNERHLAFLPVVDADGRLCEAIVRGRKGAGVFHALVMAGGFGKRLGARTADTPKPLIEVGGRPILDRVLQSLEAAGVDTIFVSVHYLSEKIERFLAERRNVANLKVVHEAEPLGTAGAIGLLPTLAAAPLLVINGDVVTHADLPALHEFHVRNGHDITIGVAQYELQVPYGVIRHDEHGKFEQIVEKPWITEFVSAGVYYLSPEALALVPSGRPVDMPEILNAARSIGMTIGLFPIHEYWVDVGRPADLEAADRRLGPAGSE